MCISQIFCWLSTLQYAAERKALLVISKKNLRIAACTAPSRRQEDLICLADVYNPNFQILLHLGLDQITFLELESLMMSMYKRLVKQIRKVVIL